MILPSSVQTLVDQLVRAMGLHATTPAKIEIDLDRQGLVQHLKPTLIFRREKARLDKQS